MEITSSRYFKQVNYEYIVKVFVQVIKYAYVIERKEGEKVFLKGIKTHFH